MRRAREQEEGYSYWTKTRKNYILEPKDRLYIAEKRKKNTEKQKKAL